MCAAAALAASLVAAAAAAAGTATFVDGVLRVRSEPDGGSRWQLRLWSAAAADFWTEADAGAPTHAHVSTNGTLAAGVGCASTPAPPSQQAVALLCPLAAGPAPPRYRASLGDGSEAFEVLLSWDGVVFAGAGDDTVSGARARAYGGPGDDRMYGSPQFGGAGTDSMVGWRLSGGPGRDTLAAALRAGTVLRGGRGHDDLYDLEPAVVEASRFYGGPGNDGFVDGRPVGNMVAGGPGWDLVQIDGRDRLRDVYRLRDGGRDDVRCNGPPDRKDVMLLDRSDRFYPLCRRARVLLTGRPRSLAP